MQSQHTCGKGLAERSVLPAKAAALMAAMSDVLELHMNALDLGDPPSRKEHDVYLELSTAYRDIAAQLQAAAKEMARCAQMPMGRHDLEAMSSAGAREAFETFVEIEQELLALLQATLERDRKMLAVMQEAQR
jgi:hypothetical protein